MHQFAAPFGANVLDLNLWLCAACVHCVAFVCVYSILRTLFISNLMFVLTFLKSLVLSRRDSTILILTAGKTKWPIIHSQNLENCSAQVEQLVERLLNLGRTTWGNISLFSLEVFREFSRHYHI